MSTTAAEVLVDEGYTNVLELDGGFDARKAQGRELLEKRQGFSNNKYPGPGKPS